MALTNSQKVRWGIIGCGQIAYDKAIPALAAAENAELAALCDPDQARLERAQAAAPQARSYAEVEALLNDPSSKPCTLVPQTTSTLRSRSKPLKPGSTSW